MVHKLLIAKGMVKLRSLEGVKNLTYSIDEFITR
jgi:hypothetical protein